MKKNLLFLTVVMLFNLCLATAWAANNNDCSAALENKAIDIADDELYTFRASKAVVESIIHADSETPVYTFKVYADMNSIEVPIGFVYISADQSSCELTLIDQIIADDVEVCREIFPYQGRPGGAYDPCIN